MATKISRILHAGYVFECQKFKVAFDPIFENPFSYNCYAYPKVQFDFERIQALQFDAIFISHFHDDHCSFESLRHLHRQTPIYIFCLHPEMILWIQELGFLHVHSIQLNKPIQVGPFRVIPRRALDADVDSIFHIEVEDLHILNVVDSWIDEEVMGVFAKTPSWDLILWPFQTLRELEVLSPKVASPAPRHLPPEWLEQLQILKPKYVIPSSCQFIHEPWSWYNQALFPISYQQFTQELKAVLPATKVLQLLPSTSVELTGNRLNVASPLDFIKLLDEEIGDYHFDPNLKPPNTAEIAKHFPALTQEQSKFAHDYCRSTLLKKYKDLPTSAETFFNEPLVWQLSVYDHRGNAKSYYYKINGSSISILQSAGEISWSTEVSVAKLYSALTSGESLSSMYIRVNDLLCSQFARSKVTDVEVIADPLIRCLFEGEFGAYQKAQLDKIKSIVTQD